MHDTVLCVSDSYVKFGSRQQSEIHQYELANLKPFNAARKGTVSPLPQVDLGVHYGIPCRLSIQRAQSPSLSCIPVHAINSHPTQALPEGGQFC